MTEKWSLQGYDAFAEEFYRLDGEYDSENAARSAGVAQLKSVEESQPTLSSGGQGDMGIQDRFFIVRPDGSQYRFIPRTEELEPTE